MSLEPVVASLVQQLEHRFYGKYRGLVVDNADPQQLGRLKLRVPSVLGDQLMTGWALPCVPYGGMAGQGLLFIPEPGAGVWVEFEEGDLEFPIWVGTFWSRPDGTSELPRPNDADGKDQDKAQNPPSRKIIKTKKGHTIQLEDQDGEELILISQQIDADKRNTIMMNKDGFTISSQNSASDDKQHEITLDKKGITITDAVNKNNQVVLSSTGITIVDGVHNSQIALDDQGITISDGVNKSTIVFSSSGITIADGQNNKVTLEAGGIKLGASASQQLVKGTAFKEHVDSFVIALSTHTHTGNLGAPTSPPMTSFQLDVPLSTTTRTE